MAGGRRRWRCPSRSALWHQSISSEEAGATGAKGGFGNDDDDDGPTTSPPPHLRSRACACMHACLLALPRRALTSHHTTHFKHQTSVGAAAASYYFWLRARQCASAQARKHGEYVLSVRALCERHAFIHFGYYTIYCTCRDVVVVVVVGTGSLAY